MWLDLKDVIEVPGASKTFQTALDPEHLLTPAIHGFRTPPETKGSVTNTAGLLNLRAEVRAEMACVCDRCGMEFDREKILRVDVPLAADAEDDADADVFPLEGDGVDVTGVLETCFILETESKLLCRDDCKGLCPNCGRNLNDGPCDCKNPMDPRFAVLEQLLDKEEIE